MKPDELTAEDFAWNNPDEIYEREFERIETPDDEDGKTPNAKLSRAAKQPKT